MMMRLVFLHVLTLWCVVTFAKANISQEWTLDRVMKSRSQIKEARVSFIEKKILLSLSEPIVLKGSLFFRAPQYLEKHYVFPEDTLYKINESNVSIIKQNAEQQFLSLDEYPVLNAFIESLRGILAGDLGRLKEYYFINFSVNGANWKIKLTPNDDDLAEYIEEILISGHATDLLGIEVIESTGDRSITTLLPVSD